MTTEKNSTHHKRQTALTREEKRRRQRLSADLKGLGVIAALLGIGVIIGSALRRGR